VTSESTEETYIGGLTQAWLKEVNRDKHRSDGKSGELLLPLVRRVRERAPEGDRRSVRLLSRTRP